MECGVAMPGKHHDHGPGPRSGDAGEVSVPGVAVAVAADGIEPPGLPDDPERISFAKVGVELTSRVPDHDADPRKPGSGSCEVSKAAEADPLVTRDPAGGDLDPGSGPRHHARRPFMPEWRTTGRGIAAAAGRRLAWGG